MIRASHFRSRRARDTSFDLQLLSNLRHAWFA
jgi:hypothetical protein